jgi:hypothetical protein
VFEAEDTLGGSPLRAHFDTVEVIPEMSPEPQHHTPAECLAVVVASYPDHAALDVLPSASRRVIDGAYRAQAMDHHPDHAGPSSHQCMIRVNQAYAELTRNP